MADIIKTSIKSSINKPKILENGKQIEYEQISINYKNGYWGITIKIDGNWYEVNTSDDKTKILI